MQLILKLVLGLATLYAVVALAAFFFQRRLTYFPDPERIAPASFNLPGVEERVIATADGEKLVAWFAAPKDGKPLVIYFHGNAGALNLRANRFRNLVADGNGLIGLSYRGYGGSSGAPSEAGLIADARAAYDYAAARVPAERRIVLLGNRSAPPYRRQCSAPRRRSRSRYADPRRRTVPVGRRGGGVNLLVPAGALPDAGSIFVRRPHRQSKSAGSGDARRARHYRADPLRRGAVQARQRAQAVRALCKGHARQSRRAWRNRNSA